MTLHVEEKGDRTKDIVRGNLDRIRLIAVAGTVFINSHQKARLMMLLRNRKEWGTEPPLVMAAIHRNVEAEAFAAFMRGPVG